MMTTYLPYYLFVVLVFGSAFVNRSKNARLRRLIEMTLIVLLSLFSAFRPFGVGADDGIYSSSIVNEEIRNLIHEPLYRMLLAALESIGANYSILLGLTTLVFCLGAQRFSNKCNTPFAFWLLFYIAFGHYFELNFDHIRNALALGVSLFSFSYAVEQRKIPALTFLVLAILVHFTTLIFAPVVIISFLEIRHLKYIIIILAFIAPTVFIFTPVLDLNQIIAPLSLINVIDHESKITIATKLANSERHELFRVSIYNILKISISIIAIFVLLSRQNREIDRINTVCIISYAFGVISILMLRENYALSGRVMRSFSIFEPVVIIYLINVMCFRARTLLFVSICILLLIISFYIIPNRSLPFVYY